MCSLMSHFQQLMTLSAQTTNTTRADARADKQQRLSIFLPALKETEVKSRAVGCYVSCSHTQKYWMRSANISLTLTLHAKSTSSKHHHHHHHPPSDNGHRHKWSHSDPLQASAILQQGCIIPICMTAARMYWSSGFKNQKNVSQRGVTSGVTSPRGRGHCEVVSQSVAGLK